MKLGAMKRGALNLRSSQLLLPSLLLLWPTAASAHITGDQAGGFISGFEHPISGLDHIVAITLCGAGFGAWTATMIGVDVPNTRLKRFEEVIEKGELLMMVDVAKDRVEEIEEVIYHMTGYAGYPAAVSARKIAREVIRR